MEDKNDVVMIKLDRMRELRFGHKALKKLGALTGKTIDVLTLAGEVDLDTMEMFLYCGLLSDARANKEDLKLEDMEDLIDQGEYFDIIPKIQIAIERSYQAFGAGEPDTGKSPTLTK